MRQMPQRVVVRAYHDLITHRDPVGKANLATRDCNVCLVDGCRWPRILVDQPNALSTTAIRCTVNPSLPAAAKPALRRSPTRELGSGPNSGIPKPVGS